MDCYSDTLQEIERRGGAERSVVDGAELWRLTPGARAVFELVHGLTARARAAEDQGIAAACGLLAWYSVVDPGHLSSISRLRLR